MGVLDPTDERRGSQLQSASRPNLFVGDGAVFPTQSCYEPTLTIMAIAARAGEHIAESFRRGEL